MCWFHNKVKLKKKKYNDKVLQNSLSWENRVHFAESQFVDSRSSCRGELLKADQRDTTKSADISIKRKKKKCCHFCVFFFLRFLVDQFFWVCQNVPSNRVLFMASSGDDVWCGNVSYDGYATFNSWGMVSGPALFLFPFLGFFQMILPTTKLSFTDRYGRRGRSVSHLLCFF